MLARCLNILILNMVIAHTPVELAQIKKLLYAVRTSNYDEIRRLCQKGVDDIVNYNNPIDGNQSEYQIIYQYDAFFV